MNKIILLTYCPLNVLTYFGGNYMVTSQRGTYFFLKKGLGSCDCPVSELACCFAEVDQPDCRAWRSSSINIAIETSNQYENQICDVHRSKTFNKTKHSIKTFVDIRCESIISSWIGPLIGLESAHVWGIGWVGGGWFMLEYEWSSRSGFSLIFLFCFRASLFWVFFCLFLFSFFFFFWLLVLSLGVKTPLMPQLWSFVGLITFFGEVHLYPEKNRPCGFG